MLIHESWQQHIPLVRDGYHEKLLTEIIALQGDATFYPPFQQVFYALQVTPFTEVKVVIVGQDPYHGPGQAHGLAFSVPEGVNAPPSLRNIFKEIETDIYEGDAPLFSTDLTRWALQGVLLLNASLTVEAGKAGSHQGIGWQRLTDQILCTLSQEREHLVFMLWGRHAHLKKELLEGQKHCILEAPHPSPLSAYRGFWGCRHFSRANQYLVAHDQTPVSW